MALLGFFFLATPCLRRLRAAAGNWEYERAATSANEAVTEHDDCRLVVKTIYPQEDRQLRYKKEGLRHRVLPPTVSVLHETGYRQRLKKALLLSTFLLSPLMAQQTQPVSTPQPNCILQFPHWLHR